MTDHDTREITEATSSSGRRELFGKAGAAVAAAAVVGLTSSRSADAANGDNMIVGEINEATSSTQLQGGSSLVVYSGTSPAGHQASIRGYATDEFHVGVQGEAVAPGGIGVQGLSDDDGSVGVHGRNTGGGGAGMLGVYHNTTRAGAGVIGASTFGTGVVGQGTDFDLRAGLSGRLSLEEVGHAGSPGDAGVIGTVARDAAGNLWYCHDTGRWQRLAGPTAAGAFHPIAPIRAFDSRRASIPGNGVFAAGSSRVISIKDGRDATTGTVIEANAIPAGATAVAFNVTATGTSEPSFLAVVPGDVATTSVSTLNWSAGGTTIANSGIVGLDDSRQINVIAGPGGGFHCIIDISGFYL